MPVQLTSLKRFKAAIFDLDGVMVDSEKAHLFTFNQALSGFGIRIKSSFWKRNYTGIGSYAIMKDVFLRNGIKEDVKKWVKKRAALYQEYVESAGLPTIKGFHSIYALLKRHKVHIAVASGGHKPHIAASLRSIGLARMPFVGLEDVKHGKPSPDIFLLAAEKLKAKPSECIIFEDSLAGVEAAKRAGMSCIALTTTVPKNALRGKAALVVRDFSSRALHKLISSLMR
ncbi:TPA: HAD family phosphatase [Candidatus Micrarchaeota archaeon]|nr:HAD family phosphatase [Candidatus Micrarchaeota archaeon]HIH30089.1 HAD family phosphatase [Candidatus Micrarchaeota archaeon]